MSDYRSRFQSHHRQTFESLLSGLESTPSVENARKLLAVLAPMRRTILKTVRNIIGISALGCRRLVVCGLSGEAAESHTRPFVEGFRITDREGVEYYLGADTDLREAVIDAVRKERGDESLDAEASLALFGERLACDDLDTFLYLLDELAPLVVQVGEVVFIDDE